MDLSVPFVPIRLQTQVFFSRDNLGLCRFMPRHLDDVPPSLLRLVETASGKPAQIQRALAYTIPTSQLAGLIPLIASEDNTLISQTANQLLHHRLRPRLAGPIWQHFQQEPERPVFAELMLSLAQAALSAHHGRISADLESSVQLVTLVINEQNGVPVHAETLFETICQHLIRCDLKQQPVADVLSHYHLEISSPLVRQLLFDYFSQANQTSLTINSETLANWLSFPKAMPWAVISHYGKTMHPEQWDDRIGSLVEQAFAEERVNPADVLNPVAVMRFRSWQKLDSLRRLLEVPRQIELLSRYYYLFQEPAERISSQTISILMTRLVLVLRSGEESLYLYPIQLYRETKTRWHEQKIYEANLAAAAEGMDELDADTEAAIVTPADPPEDPDRWPIDQSLVIFARQALLNEQDKRLDEHTLVDELVNNMKVSIIKLFLDDAHYLFARKIFDEIAVFEGLRPESI